MAMIQGRAFTGGSDAIRGMFYSPPSAGVVKYLNDHMERGMEFLQDRSSQLVSTVTQLHTAYNSDAALDRLDRLAYGGDMMINENVVTYLDREHIIQAGTTMRNHVLTCPEVYKLHMKDRCSGYNGEVYLKELGHAKVEDTVEYQQVMDGFYDEDKDELIQYYIDTDDSDVDELRFEQQIAIQKTWNTARGMINDGLDPTDVNGGSL